jgi:hypothetical protein
MLCLKLIFQVEVGVFGWTVVSGRETIVNFEPKFVSK